MLIVGLTGGIASGKTTVANELAAKGAAIIDSDLLAREVVLPGQPAYQEIAAAWPDVILEDGAIDRAKLGAIIFNDPMARQRLNAMTHPRIRALTKERLEALASSQTPPAMAVSVVPLLFENGLENTVQETWLVAVEPETQRLRLIERDGFSAREAEQRIASQMPLAQKLARATRVIRNDGNQAQLKAEIERVWLEAGLPTREREE